MRGKKRFVSYRLSRYEGTTDAELRFLDTKCSTVAKHIDQTFSHNRIIGDSIEMLGRDQDHIEVFLVGGAMRGCR